MAGYQASSQLEQVLAYLASLQQQQQPQDPKTNPISSGLNMANTANTASSGLGWLSGSGAGAELPLAMSEGPTGLGLLGSPSAAALGAEQAGPLSALAPEVMGATPAYVPAAAALGTFLGGRSGLRMLQGKQKNWKDASLADNAGRVTLGIATGGLSEVANKLFGGHKSTKQQQTGRWNELFKAGKAPETAFANGVNQDQGVDDNKLASGSLGGRDVWATSGMFDTFGKDWATMYDEQKREQIAKRMLDEKLFDSRKGITNVTNKDRAQQIASEVGGSDPRMQNMIPYTGNVSVGTAQSLISPTPAAPTPGQPDAGTLKRWREQKQKTMIPKVKR
jgi:hypothetical protein